MQLTGILVGWLLGLFSAVGLDYWRQRREAKGIVTALYFEIADRSARCTNDFLEPWQRFRHGLSPADAMTADRVGKFRPTEPVVYPQLIAKLALVRPDAVAAVQRFYFRLDALRREIDSFTSDFDPGEVPTGKSRHRVTLVARRFEETVRPALLALETLNEPTWEKIDREVAAEYGQLNAYGKSLRDALRDCQRKVSG